MSGPDKNLVAEFMRLTEPHHGRLLRIARALCRDVDQAADITQEALVRAFRAFDSYRSGAPVLPWLARILRNVHLDLVKSGRARYELPAKDLDLEGDALDAFASHGPSPLEALERAELAALLAEELEALDPGARLIVLLCDVEELSYEEAAEVAGIPVGTVRSRLSRSRAQLRDRLRQRVGAGADQAYKHLKQ